MNDDTGSANLKSLKIGPWLTCPWCSAPLTVEYPPIEEYLHGQKGFCLACTKEKPFDWWECIVSSVKSGFLFGPFSAIGAITALFQITLKPAQAFELRFSAYGIPDSAKILQVIYTANYDGGLFPVEMHSNNPARHSIPPVITLWPTHLGREMPTTTLVNVAVTWVSSSDDDLAWQHLVEAFEALAAKKIKSAIIPANVAVESTLASLLDRFLTSKQIGADRVKSFLSDGATYSHQLNVVLPAILSFTKAPSMPKELRGRLNRLRDLRNDLAHRTSIKTKTSLDEVAECLCAAVFGFSYLKIAEKYLD